MIGAEDSSLDKILHAADIKVTASAVSQRRTQITPAVVFRAVLDSFNSDCVDDSLANVVIPAGMPELIFMAFGNCPNLTNVTIPPV